MDLLNLVVIIQGALILTIVVAVLMIRYKKEALRHRERLAAIEKGIEAPAGLPVAPWTPRVYLLRGMIWLFTGTALTVAAFGILMSIDKGPDPESRLIMKLQREKLMREHGATPEQIREVEANRATYDDGEGPEMLALLGLVPIGVGLAYLLFYVGERKRTGVT